MASTTSESATVRDVGVPPGRNEYTETVRRWIFPDGTQADAPPQRTVPTGPFKALLAAFGVAGLQLPMGTRTVFLQRTVTTEATPWREIPTEVTTETQVELT